MIEIRSRYDNRVLYTAQNATDVRTALTEARDQGANLWGANLQGAYLQGANLRGANLQDANLQGANLQGANLQGANLRGANLQGAYLQDTYLQDANLQDANLQDANLQGANLRGADWSQVVDVLERALAEVSITGHWIKEAMSRTLDDGAEAYCASGAVESCGSGVALAIARSLLAGVSGGAIEPFNDHVGTTLVDVQTAFRLAIRHAQRFGGVKP